MVTTVNVSKGIKAGLHTFKNAKEPHLLPCPICGTKNPVSKANLRLRCSKCRTQLLSVKVRKAKK